nr:IS110 family transposase [Candidatus Freyarchaeota archaeon]
MVCVGIIVVLYIGIDVHKKFCYVCIKDEEGNIIKEFKVRNNRSGTETLLSIIGDKRAKAVLESTGNFWIRLYTQLEEAGVEVVLSNPKKNKAIAGAKIKNDRRNARTLADLLRTNLITPCYVPPPKTREIRTLIRHQINLTRSRTRSKNRIHALLSKYELEEDEEEDFTGSDQFGKAGWEWLKKRFGGGQLSEADQFTLGAEFRQVELLDQLIEEVNLKIAEESFGDENVKLLMTISGVDYYTALLFVSEIGDVSRFPSAAKLASWLGIVPELRESGERSRRGGITKEGSPRVRWALVQAARSAVRWDPHFAEKYNRIMKRRGDGKAIVAIARELAVAMYHMLTRGEQYRFRREESVKRKFKKLERRVRNANNSRTGIALEELPPKMRELHV